MKASRYTIFTLCWRQHTSKASLSLCIPSLYSRLNTVTRRCVSTTPILHHSICVNILVQSLRNHKWIHYLPTVEISWNFILQHYTERFIYNMYYHWEYSNTPDTWLDFPCTMSECKLVFRCSDKFSLYSSLLCVWIVSINWDKGYRCVCSS